MHPRFLYALAALVLLAGCSPGSGQVPGAGSSGAASGKEDTMGTTGLYDPSPARASGLEVAVLAGGCFWCIEAVYEYLPGIRRAVSGYTGGSKAQPSYEAVCTGTTGHAEAVVLEFDPRVISYDRILEIFWKAHDPTSLNRQGADQGTQYRSAVYWTSPEQKRIIQESMDRIKSHYDRPLVTQVEALGDFWLAEDYHQDYFENHPNQGYCAAVIKPKLDKLKLPRLKQ